MGEQGGGRGWCHALQHRDQQLTKAEFVEVLRTWDEIYHGMEEAGFQDNSMIQGLLRVAAAFYVPDRLVSTPAAYRIEKAKLIAKKNGDIHEVRLIVSEAIHILTN